jgi:FtsZ-binding cell division protein ZapB
MKIEEIENTLRQAPQPKPPAGLKNELMAQIHLPVARTISQPRASLDLSSSWLRRWWPALAPGAVAAFGAVVIAVQQIEIRELKQSIQTLAGEIAEGRQATENPDPRGSTSITPNGVLLSHEEEIERLKEKAGLLADEIKEVEKMRLDNADLRAQLAAPLPNLPPEFQAMEDARQGALSTACVNNLKQIGLAARLWTNDSGGELLPPDFASMSAFLKLPKLLICPGDNSRQPAEGWASFTSANSSYELLAASGSETEPSRVLTRCPVHGHVGLIDGSVHQINSPERLAERDGKLYMRTTLTR